MSKKLLWLRSESKAFEKRCPLTPEGAKVLIDQGVAIHVESSSDRIFSTEAYQKVGCAIEEEHSWASAPEHATILGLKELPEDSFPLRHTHIYFAHCFKGQTGSEALLNRFQIGNGCILDLEFLKDSSGRRVAAFGYWAGFVGAALAVEAFAAPENFAINPIHHPNVESYIKKLDQVEHPEKVLIIGSKGRSGSGARTLFERLGISATLWDRQETQNGGPFQEILEHDVLVNCVFLQNPIAPFLTVDFLSKNDRLRIVSDVSCDPTSPHNPLPIYKSATTFKKPLVKVEGPTQPVYVQAIDHLPSLLPKESSEEFAKDLLPHLLDYFQNGSAVWNGASEIFQKHLQQLTNR